MRKLINPMRRSAAQGFTLIELLVVIAIIALLAGLILPVLAESRRRARITQCQTLLSQFHKGIVIWNDTHDRFSERYPDRLGTMYFEKIIPDARAFLCPLDPNLGHEGGKPPIAASQYPETDEGPGVNGLPSDHPWSSYLYEFNGAKCTWWSGGTTVSGVNVDTNGDGTVSWQEAKFYQQKYGDSFLYGSGYDGEYPRTWFPVVRCFWHAKLPDSNAESEIMNVAMDGNFFPSGPKWELEAIKYVPK